MGICGHLVHQMSMEVEENKQRLLETAYKLILKYGVKSMTMDDIARGLGISKKTLYQYALDKNDLVKQIIHADMQINYQKINSIIHLNLKAIDESFEIFKTIIQSVDHIPPNILYDLKKYHPEAYVVNREFMWTFARKCIDNNLTKGIEEGYYRPDIKIPVISSICILMVMNMFENANAYGKPITDIELFKELFNYHINALASEKGRKYLSDKFTPMNFNR